MFSAAPVKVPSLYLALPDEDPPEGVPPDEDPPEGALFDAGGAVFVEIFWLDELLVASGEKEVLAVVPGLLPTYIPRIPRMATATIIRTAFFIPLDLSPTFT